MSKIHKLSEKTINQIAAGEVIDRPASVVKELVENSIDANSTFITIEIEDGGRSLIRVTDDGCGIDNEDLELAIERHATSKLDERDLNFIKSLGFRGEALPSIGSIANVRITTRTVNCEHAYSIEVRGGHKSVIQPASGVMGTTIEVRDLFIHTPARLKFMRASSTEKANIIMLIQQFGLCYHKIHFVLIIDGKQAANYKKADSFQSRLETVFGKSFTENMIPLSRQGKEMSINGHIGLPTFTHRNSLYQHIFINGRSVKDKQIYASIKASYSNIMASGFFPAVILNIEIDPYEVDVNVHPAKTEVRLRDPNRVKAFVISALRGALSDNGAKSSTQVTEAALDIAKKYGGQYQNPKNNNYISNNDQYKKPVLNFSDVSMATYHQPVANNDHLMKFSKPIEINEKVEQRKLGEAIFQIDNTYIVAHCADGLVLVDQHAVHERLVLEKMKSTNVAIDSQILLMPEVVELGEALVEHLLAYQNQLKDFGIHFERNGITQVLIRQVPQYLAKESIAQLLKELAEMIAQSDLTNVDNIEVDTNLFERKREEILGNIACHSSIRAGRKLSIPEMNAILRQLENTPLASQCNHGRPTFVILEPKSLAKIFART